MVSAIGSSKNKNKHRREKIGTFRLLYPTLRNESFQFDVTFVLKILYLLPMKKLITLTRSATFLSKKSCFLDVFICFPKVNADLKKLQ